MHFVVLGVRVGEEGWRGVVKRREGGREERAHKGGMKNRLAIHRLLLNHTVQYIVLENI